MAFNKRKILDGRRGERCECENTVIIFLGGKYMSIHASIVILTFKTHKM